MELHLCRPGPEPGLINAAAGHETVKKPQMSMFIEDGYAGWGDGLVVQNKRDVNVIPFRCIGDIGTRYTHDQSSRVDLH